MQLRPVSLRLVLVPASQSPGDLLRLQLSCIGGQVGQEAGGSLVPVLESRAVADGSPARGRFATAAPASQGRAPACRAGLRHRCATGSSAGTCSFLLRRPGRALYCFLSGCRVIKFTEADSKEVGMYYHAL